MVFVMLVIWSISNLLLYYLFPLCLLLWQKRLPLLVHLDNTGPNQAPIAEQQQQKPTATSKKISKTASQKITTTKEAQADEQKSSPESYRYLRCMAIWHHWLLADKICSSYYASPIHRRCNGRNSVMLILIINHSSKYMPNTCLISIAPRQKSASIYKV